MKENRPLQPRIYNSRIVDTYIRYLKAYHPDLNLEELLDKSGISYVDIADEGHWFTQEEVNRFHNKLVELTDQPDIARMAGRFAASPEALGSLRQYLLGFLSLDRFFAILQQTSKKLTRSASYLTRKLSPACYEITVLPHPGIQEEPFQCANRIGFIEAIGSVFDFEMPDIEHPDCLFEGGSQCRYIVTWPRRKVSSSKKWKTLTLFFTLAALIIAVSIPDLRSSPLFWHVIGYFGLTLCLALSVLENRTLMKRFRLLRDSSKQHLDQINSNYNNALIINEIGTTISQSTNIEQILTDIVQIFKSMLHYNRCAIYLANKERTRLVFRQGVSQNPEHFDMAKKFAFHLDRPESEGIFVKAFHKQEPIFTDDINHLAGKISPRSMDLAKALEVHSMICCPIVCEGESLGILAVDNFRSRRPLVKSDLSLLMGIASTLGVSIRNAELLGALKSQLGTIRARDAELQHQREVLAEQVDERTRELNEAVVTARKLAEKANEASQEKSRFLANMSHEIRTPLYGVIGMTEILLKSGLKDDQLEKAKTVFESGTMLLRIIDDILDLSKIEAGKLVFEDICFDLREQVETTRQLFTALAEKKGLNLQLKIEKQVPEFLRGDPIRLRQVLSNLVSNSIKFTEQGCVEVEVKLLALQGEKAALEFSVQDTGVGIPADKLDRVFDGFTQAEDSTARKYGGTGLGTTIARHLVELQGGTISVESDVNHGTCFRFQLEYPVAESVDPGAEHQLDYAVTAHQEQIHLLLVEDNQVNQEITRWHLEDAFKCHIDYAENGIQAVAKSISARYDLILMDLQMPEMDGITATEMIRRNGLSHQDLPIIGLTANILGEDHRRCIQAGMNDVLHKPLTREVLLAAVQKWLSGRSRSHSMSVLPADMGKRIDPAKLLAEFKGDRSAVAKVTSLYLRDTREKLSLVRQALDDHDSRAVGEYAHAIKGSAANVMSFRAATIAQRIEEMAQKKRWVAIGEAVAELDSELDYFEQELKNNHSEQVD